MIGREPDAGELDAAELLELLDALPEGDAGAFEDLDLNESNDWEFVP